jgi:hypothetical protein
MCVRFWTYFKSPKYISQKPKAQKRL